MKPRIHNLSWSELERRYWINLQLNNILANQEYLDTLRSEQRTLCQQRRLIKLEKLRENNERLFRNMCNPANYRKPIFNWVKKNCQVSPIAILKDDEGYFVTDAVVVRNMLTEYWNSIFINVINLPNPPYNHIGDLPGLRNFAQNNNPLLNGNITVHEVIVACKRFKNNGDSGTSDIPVRAIKNFDRGFIDRLVDLFNDWFNNHNYPREGQHSRITLLPKTGKDLTKLQSYRTLSVGCNLCKLYLRILEARIITITENCHLLGETQNGFRPNRRSADNIFILGTVNRVVRKKGWKSFMSFIDLTKAFDRINRDKLWQKMRWFGFPNNLIDAIESTYSHPSATLSFQGIEAENLPMPIGLRQGCVLSPILFAIYMADFSFLLQRMDTGVPLEYINNNFGNNYDNNNVPVSFKVDLCMYADDIVLVSKNQYDLKKQLQILSQFCINNEIQINCDKSFIIPLNRPANDNNRWAVYTNLPPEYHSSIPETNEGKYLGIAVKRGNNLFRNQAGSLKRKITFNKWELLTLLKNLEHRNWYGTIIWGTYGLPSILYGAEAMHHTKTCLNALDIVHNSYFRSVFG